MYICFQLLYPVMGPHCWNKQPHTSQTDIYPSSHICCSPCCMRSGYQCEIGVVLSTELATGYSDPSQSSPGFNNSGLLTRAGHSSGLDSALAVVLIVFTLPKTRSPFQSRKTLMTLAKRYVFAGRDRTEICAYNSGVKLVYNFVVKVSLRYFLGCFCSRSWIYSTILELFGCSLVLHSLNIYPLCMLAHLK